MRVAVVGATGMVGNVMLEVLAERNFEISELLLVASERSVGKQMQFQGKDYTIIGLQDAVDAMTTIPRDLTTREVIPTRREAWRRIIGRSGLWNLVE